MYGASAVIGHVKTFVPELLRGHVVSLSRNAFSLVIMPIMNPMLIRMSAIACSCIKKANEKTYF